MNIKFVSNDYTFKYDLNIMVAKMINLKHSHVVEFYLNNQNVYYYIIPEKDIEELDDLSIIYNAVKKMREDKNRWTKDCSFYIDNTEKFILFERSTVYNIEINEFTHQYITIRIVEENNSRFVIYLKEDMSGTTMITHLSANDREEVIDTLDAMAKLIIQVLKPFREKQEMVILNAFGTDYALRQSAIIVDNAEYGHQHFNTEPEDE